MISRHNLELNSETFKSMININVRMKDVSFAPVPLTVYFLLFTNTVLAIQTTKLATPMLSFQHIFWNFNHAIFLLVCALFVQFKGAYKMLHGLKEMNLMPTAGIYNAIMAGYFREVMLWSIVWNFYLLLIKQKKKNCLAEKVRAWESIVVDFVVYSVSCRGLVILFPFILFIFIVSFYSLLDESERLLRFSYDDFWMLDNWFGCLIIYK